jgi:carbon monoxide dehydrogenase subunit G
MEMEHKLSIDAPIADVWAALVDPERVVACMPGATLGSVDGDKFDGQIKVKIGPVALTYKGVGTFVEKDEAAHKVVLEANAKDSRGNGTAKAGIAITLTEAGEKTNGKVVTDLAVTGKPAQFGRGMLSDVGGKIIEQFADCLSNKLSAPEPAADPAPAAEPTTAVTGSAPQAGSEAPGAAPAAPQQPQQPQQEAEALDLMQYAGGSVAKRLAPVLGALIAGAVLFLVLRRRRR